MIRIGIDLVDIQRFESVLERWPRLTNRLFTDAEIEYAQARPRPSQHLAARFAAKEAAFKALGSGWPRLSWHDVEIVTGPNGPVLALSGRAQELSGPDRAIVTLSHDAGIAIAQVLVA